MRGILRMLSKFAFFVLADLKIVGLENLPKDGPTILVANHFHFSDPVALLVASSRQVEFVGGFRFPNAPKIVHFLPSLWGYFSVHRGAYSGRALKAAQNVLAQDGVLGIFPEGGAWANVLRPPRPGAAFTAIYTGAKIVPLGLDGFENLFKQLRPKLTISIGEPIGPFQATKTGKHSREEINAVGEAIMMAIAAQLPEEKRGVYSTDKVLKQAALDVAAYPFDSKELRGQ